MAESRTKSMSPSQGLTRNGGVDGTRTREENTHETAGDLRANAGGACELRCNSRGGAERCGCGGRDFRSRTRPASDGTMTPLLVTHKSAPEVVGMTARQLRQFLDDHAVPYAKSGGDLSSGPTATDCSRRSTGSRSRPLRSRGARMRSWPGRRGRRSQPTRPHDITAQAQSCRSPGSHKAGTCIDNHRRRGTSSTDLPCRYSKDRIRIEWTRRSRQQSRLASRKTRPDCRTLPHMSSVYTRIACHLRSRRCLQDRSVPRNHSIRCGTCCCNRANTPSWD